MALYAFVISLIMAFSFAGETSAAERVRPLQIAQSQSSSIQTAAKSDLIDINSASEKQLDELPGIGPATAQKIIQQRPYNSKDELVRKHIVSDRVYAEIKDRIIAHRKAGG